jgi:hypothetical protein
MGSSGRAIFLKRPGLIAIAKNATKSIGLRHETQPKKMGVASLGLTESCQVSGISDHIDFCSLNDSNSFHKNY